MKHLLILAIMLVNSIFCFSQGTWKEYRKEVRTGLIKGGNIMSYFTESKDGSIWISNTTGSIVRIKDDQITIFDDLKRSIAAQTTIGTLVNANEKTIGVWWFSCADMETGWVWFAANRGAVLWNGEDMLLLTGENNGQGRMLFLNEKTEKNYILENNELKEAENSKKVKPNNLLSNLYVVFKDSKKRVWFGGTAGKLFCLENGKLNIFSYIEDYDIDNKARTVRKIFEDTKGQIWILSHGLLLKYSNGKFEPETGLDNLEKATEIMEDSKGNIWIAGNKGLYKKEGDSWKFFGASEGIDAIPIAGQIVEDKSGNIWFAGKNTTIYTKSTGIFVLKPKGGVYKYDGSTWKKYKVGKKSLVTDIYADKDGEIWITGSTGVFKVENDQLVEKRTCSAMKSYLKIFQDSKGKMWFGRGSFKGEIDAYTE